MKVSDYEQAGSVGNAMTLCLFCGVETPSDKPTIYAIRGVICERCQPRRKGGKR